MPKRDIIVIGGSAGALEVLSSIVAKLPYDFPASVFVVIHISPTRESMLPEILTRAGRMPATHPWDEQPVESANVYVAPPDRHMVLEDSCVRIVHGPKENRSRPAIDPLFRSAAFCCGARVIGVVLSGALDDGTAGLRAIKSRGGITIVQDPADATYPSMPESAIDHNSIDHVVKADEIAQLLRRLVEEDTRDERVGSMGELKKEVQMTNQELKSEEMIQKIEELGDLSMFTCPECHGTLWELKEGALLRYRCHVGHAYSIDSLDAGQAEKVEAALWSAMRALEERGELSRKMAKQSRERRQGRDGLAARFEQRAKEADEHVESIRQMLLSDAEKSAPVSH